MALQYKFFTIPIKVADEAEAELNGFLKTVQVVTIHREFIHNGENSSWGMAVEYLENGHRPQASPGTGKKKIDYRELLSPDDFAVFAKLREWRKETAGREAVQVYTIFNNEHLAKIVTNQVTTKSGLQKIEGIGDARVRKYGDAVIQIMTEAIRNRNREEEPKNETERQPALFDSGPGKPASGLSKSS